MDKYQALEYLRSIIGDTSHLDSVVVKYTAQNDKIRELGRMLKNRDDV